MGSSPLPEPNITTGGSSLIFVSDASAEAERLAGLLRAEGYLVVDVALSILPGRARVQAPSLIICDADSEGAFETVRKIRTAEDGRPVPIIFLGDPQGRLGDGPGSIDALSATLFYRPIDPSQVIQKIRELTGPPAVGRSPSIAPSVRPPMLVPSSRPPRSTSDATGLDSEPEAPSEPRSSGSPQPLPLDSMVPVLGADGGAPLRSSMPHTELSLDLREQLQAAEDRARHQNESPSSSEELPSQMEAGEGEVPEDVLSALEEALDEDDELIESSLDDRGPETGTGALEEARAAGSGSGVPEDTGGGTTGAEDTGDSTAERGGETGPETGTIEGFLQSSLPAAGTGAGPATSVTEAEMVAAAGPSTPPGSDRTSLPPSGRPAEQEVITPRPPRPPPAESQPPSTEPPRHSSPPASAWGTALTALDAEGAGSRPPGPPSTPARSAPITPEPSTTPPPRRSGAPETVLPAVEPSPPPGGGAGDAGPSGDAASDAAIRNALASGGALRALGTAIRSRFTGSLAFEIDVGIRRLVLRDGDFVTAASGIHGESLVAFLASRGDLPQEVVRQAHKLPPYGRHAGAALIAQGHLAQDRLWPVLRAHAEWVIGRVLGMQKASVTVEREVPGRLHDEPSVFGGATGAEVLVELTRRSIESGDAIEHLGGEHAMVVRGPAERLLAECALSPEDTETLERARGQSLQNVAGVADPSFFVVLHALAELGVVAVERASPARQAPEPPPRDFLDDAAVRERVLARKSVVDNGDYFAVLGVARGATGYEIRRAYLDLRRELEPTRVLTGQTADLKDTLDEILEVLDEAYEILRDQVRRDRYRRAIEATPSYG